MAAGRKTNKISSTSTQAEKYDMLMQPFKDPDDADGLFEQITISDNERDEGTVRVSLWIVACELIEGMHSFIIHFFL